MSPASLRRPQSSRVLSSILKCSEWTFNKVLAGKTAPFGTYKWQLLSVGQCLHSATSEQMDSKKGCLPLGVICRVGQVAEPAWTGWGPTFHPLYRVVEPWHLTERGQHQHLLSSYSLMLFARAKRWGWSLVASQHSTVDLGEVTNASYILLQAGFPAWRWRVRGGGGWRVRFPLSSPPPSSQTIHQSTAHL